jgi:hypothetical protein
MMIRGFRARRPFGIAPHDILIEGANKWLSNLRP